MSSQTASTLSGYAVEVTNLVKRFGSFQAVHGLSFTIEAGEIFGLLGPNGSGETTTLNMISGLSEPTSGKVAIFGYDPRKQPADVHRILGMVPQETALYGELTAAQNLAFHAELFGYTGAEKKNRVSEMLKLAELSERANSRVNTFSGGMSRRLAIVRSMLHDPKLLYLDEPTLGVDVQSRNTIWEYILKIKSEGCSVLLTTNYLEEANALCDRIAIIDHGELVALASPAELKAKYGSSVIDLELDKSLSEADLNKITGYNGVQSAKMNDNVLQVTFDPASEKDPGALVPVILENLTAGGYVVSRMSLREPSLDEVFLSLTGKGVRE